MQVQRNIDTAIAARYLDKQLSAGDSLAVLLQKELRRIRRCFYFSEVGVGPLKTIEQLSTSLGLTAQQVHAGSQAALLHIHDNMIKAPDSIFIVEGDAVMDMPKAIDTSGNWFVTYPSKSGIWEPPDYSTKKHAYSTFCYALPSGLSAESLRSVLRNARGYPLVGAHGTRPATWAASAGVPRRDSSVLEQIAASAMCVLTDAFDGEVDLIVELA